MIAQFEAISRHRIRARLSFAAVFCGVALATVACSSGQAVTSPATPTTLRTPATLTPTASPTATPSPAPTETPAPAPVVVQPPVAAQAPPPNADPYPAATAAGASAVCADRTWSYSKTRSGTCSSHGGVHWWTGNLGAAGPGAH